jgi:predicted PurR-regulated permease PerM
MERKKPLTITSSVIISLALLLLLIVPANVNAQITAPQFSELNTTVTGIVQDTQTAVTKWNNGYFAGSLKELEPQFNPGIAADGTYSSLISGASLKSKEMPYYGPISGGFYW